MLAKQSAFNRCSMKPMMINWKKARRKTVAVGRILVKLTEFKKKKSLKKVIISSTTCARNKKNVKESQKQVIVRKIDRIRKRGRR